MASSRRRKLKKTEVLQLIAELQQEGSFTSDALLAFAEKINGATFAEEKLKKQQGMSRDEAKNAVLQKFDCKNGTELRKNKTFAMAMAGETYGLRSREDWLKLYRRWIGVPKEERNQEGKTCINGIDVLENFRPWHVFGLDSSKATKEDVVNSFRSLVKIHHPDVGGDRRVFEQLEKMKNSILALMK